MLVTFTSRAALAMGMALLALTAHAKPPAYWHTLTTSLKLTLEEAMETATRAVPGRVVEMELESDNGAHLRYEAEVLSTNQERVEVWVDAMTGQAQTHKNKGKARDRDVQRANSVRLDARQAVDKATAHTPGRAIKMELDERRGKTIYQVDVLQPDYTVMELELDAADGRVLRAKRD